MIRALSADSRARGLRSHRNRERARERVWSIPRREECTSRARSARGVLALVKHNRHARCDLFVRLSDSRPACVSCDSARAMTVDALVNHSHPLVPVRGCPCAVVPYVLRGCRRSGALDRRARRAGGVTRALELSCAAGTTGREARRVRKPRAGRAAARGPSSFSREAHSSSSRPRPESLLARSAQVEPTEAGVASRAKRAGRAAAEAVAVRARARPTAPTRSSPRRPHPRGRGTASLTSPARACRPPTR